MSQFWQSSTYFEKTKCFKEYHAYELVKGNHAFPSQLLVTCHGSRTMAMIKYGPNILYPLNYLNNKNDKNQKIVLIKWKLESFL